MRKAAWIQQLRKTDLRQAFINAKNGDILAFTFNEQTHHWMFVEKEDCSMGFWSIESKKLVEENSGFFGWIFGQISNSESGNS